MGERRRRREEDGGGWFYDMAAFELDKLALNHPKYVFMH